MAINGASERDLLERSHSADDDEQLVDLRVSVLVDEEERADAGLFRVVLDVEHLSDSVEQSGCVPDVLRG